MYYKIDTFTWRIYRKFFYDGKHSMQTRGLIVLLVSKAAGRGQATFPLSQADNVISGIYPTLAHFMQPASFCKTM